MSNDRLLSQEEIDSVFKKASGTRAVADAGSKAESYDFRRPDRIAKISYGASICCMKALRAAFPSAYLLIYGPMWW